MKSPERTAWIVDASVALKWFMPASTEPDSDLARATIGRFPLKTTTLAMYEVGNRLTRSGGMSSHHVEEALVQLVEICGEPEPLIPADFGPAAELAQTHRITFYDASYVAIANRLNREVLSADSDLTKPGLAKDLTALGRPAT